MVNADLYLVGGHGEPIVVEGRLFLEGAVKDLLDVVESESANSRTRNGVGRRRERGVDDVHSLAVVSALVRTGRRFCKQTKRLRFIAIA